jgi:DNA-directed RNA polymerase specialized sigma24 family protein
MRIDKLSSKISYTYYALGGDMRYRDDAVQEILLRMLEGRHKRATISQAVIDYMRRESGRKGSINYNNKKIVEYKDTIALTNNKLDVDSYISSNFTKEQRISFILYYKWGFTLKEISDVIGVSAKQVFKYLKRIKVEK